MSVKRFLTFILIAALQLINAVYAYGEDTPLGGTFTFYQENDLYTGTGADHDYTNGLKMTWSSPDLTEYRDDPALPSWGQSLMKSLPFFDGPGFLLTVSFSLGQNIYTPRDITKGRQDDADRPYAGITYCAIGFHSRNSKIMDTWEFDLGIIGPHSYAEKMQKAVHHWTNSKYPEGWETQIKDEPFLDIYYDRKWRISPKSEGRGFGYDAIPHAGCAVGNAFTSLNLGGQIRFGWNLPNDFGTHLIGPGSDTNDPIDDKDPRFSKRPPRFGVHFFTALDGYARLIDITLDGNNFRSSDRVEKYPFVMNMAGGLGIIAGRFKFTYAYVVRSKEYTTQNKYQRYGSVTISYTFEH